MRALERNPLATVGVVLDGLQKEIDALSDPIERFALVWWHIGAWALHNKKERENPPSIPRDVEMGWLLLED